MNGVSPEGALRSAISHLGAIEAEPGVYVYPIGTGEGRVNGGYGAVCLCGLQAFADDPSSSPWKTDPRWIVLPRWWRPDRRDAWRVAAGNVSSLFPVRYENATAAADAAESVHFLNRSNIEQITVDLSTGKEVLANA